MSLPDKHDPRLFRHYAKFAPDGRFIGIVEYVSNKDIPPSDSHFIDVTSLIAHDFTGATEASLRQAVDAMTHG